MAEPTSDKALAKPSSAVPPAETAAASAAKGKAKFTETDAEAMAEKGKAKMTEAEVMAAKGKAKLIDAEAAAASVEVMTAKEKEKLTEAEAEAIAMALKGKAKLTETEGTVKEASTPPKPRPSVHCAILPCRCPEHDPLIMQNHANFKRSAPPARMMFYRGGSWEDFQAQELESFRCCFVEGKVETELDIGEKKYAYDFLRMVQVDLGSGKPRSIAWIDEKGKPFFPKMFLDEDMFDEEIEEPQTLKLDIEVRIDDEENKDGAKRKMESLNNVDVRGKEREPIENEATQGGGEGSGSKKQRLITSKWPNARLVGENEKAYSFVSNLFLSKITLFDPEATISAIHVFRLIGPLERVHWGAFEKQIELTKAARGEANVVYAWYAATPEAVVSILNHGFGGNPGGETSEVPAYGPRIYLSHLNSPHLSAMQLPEDDYGEKHIILCRVILGNLEKVDAGSQQSSPSSADFDTGTDEPVNPKWYVVWSTNMNTHVLPECLVTCKTSLARAQPRPATSLELSKSFSDVMKNLPLAKQQAIHALNDLHKAGGIDRETFLQKLNIITGDEVLVSRLRNYWNLISG